jgi:hypothetical protein
MPAPFPRSAVVSRRPSPRLLTAHLLAGFLGVAALIALVAPPPAAAAVYRYWGYFEVGPKNTWSFATKGAAQTKPADGAVEGWRFAIVGTTPRLPRTSPDFDAVCRSTPAKAGSKRVAVYIDYGLAEEAPKGGGTPPPPAAACAVVPTTASGQDVLDSVADVRKDAKSGLLCGIDSYPATGCGDQVQTAPKVANPEPPVQFAMAAPTPTTTPGPSPQDTAAVQTNAGTGHTLTYVLTAAVVVALLGGGALLLARRRGRGDGDDADEPA